MAIHINKELAFIKLAIEEDLYPESIAHHLNDLAVSGVPLAPVILEKIIELRTGQSQLQNEAHRDFADNSDAKTSTCSSYVTNKGYTTHKGMIGSAEHKIGYIRAAIYNEHTRNIDFFLIPPASSKDNLINYNYHGCIPYTYNVYSRKYSNGLEFYRKKTLKEMCANINRLKKAA